MDSHFAAATQPTNVSTKSQVKMSKKVITVMDEETGEEFTKTVWVDEDGNEVKDEPVATPAPIGKQSALGEKTNATENDKKNLAPAKKKETPAPKKAQGGIASFFGKK